MTLAPISKCSRDGRSGRSSRDSSLLELTFKVLRHGRLTRSLRVVISFSLMLSVVRHGMFPSPAQFSSLFFLSSRNIILGCPLKLEQLLISFSLRFNRVTRG